MSLGGGCIERGIGQVTVWSIDGSRVRWFSHTPQSSTVLGGRRYRALCTHMYLQYTQYVQYRYRTAERCTVLYFHPEPSQPSQILGGLARKSPFPCRNSKSVQVIRTSNTTPTPSISHWFTSSHTHVPYCTDWIPEPISWVISLICSNL